MKVLMAHNAYQQRGGEDVVFEQENAMLSSSGIDVRRFTVRNDHIVGFFSKIMAAKSVITNKASAAALLREVDSFKPDLVHIHNFFPTLSPSVIDVVARRGIPVIQTLHNYRLICAGAMLLREGAPCESCVGGSWLPGVIHGCYRGSRVGSAVIGVMGGYFKQLLQKYPESLTLIALTEFAKSRFVADGFPAQKITVRGNVIADPGTGLDERQRRIVYVGRLSSEKGVDTLLRAARNLDGIVEIVGDGPERRRLEESAPPNVLFRGQLSQSDVLERIKSATALAVPSRWYEGFPMVVLEAMATGTPILASRLGSLAEIVEDGKTGLLLSPDDPEAWNTAIAQLLTNQEYANSLGGRARCQFLERHSEQTGLKTLREIYNAALARTVARKLTKIQ